MENRVEQGMANDMEPRVISRLIGREKVRVYYGNIQQS